MSHHLDLDKVIISGINVFWPKWVLTPCLCQDTVREACLGPEHQFFAFESISVCNSGSLLRKSLILCLYLKFQSQRTAKEWTILPVRFFFPLSFHSGILVSYLFFFFFFSWDWDHKLQEVHCMKRWKVMQENTLWVSSLPQKYRYLSKHGFVGEI